MPDRSSREVYECVLGTVRHNTHNEVQGVLTSERTVRTVAGHAGIESDRVQSALTAAVDNGDLLRVERDDATRYTLADEDRLTSVIELAVAETPPDKSLVATVNRLLADCRG